MTTLTMPAEGLRWQEWYASNFRNGPAHDPRCLAVLASLAPLYRLPIVDDTPLTTFRRNPDGWLELEDYWESKDRMLDGGIRHEAPNGLSVVLNQEISTWDDSALTRLVIAAHLFGCRVSIEEATVTCHDDIDVKWFSLVYNRSFAADAPIHGNDWPFQLPVGVGIRIYPRVPRDIESSMFGHHPGIDDSHPDSLIKRAQAAAEAGKLVGP